MSGFDADRTKAYLDQGYNVICATCVKLPEGLSKRMSGCGVSTCGGPMKSEGPRAFPDYDGPIPAENLPRLCMKCGHSKIVRQIVIGDKRLGLCASHKELFSRMKFEVKKESKGFVTSTNAAKLLMIEV